jgi:NAD(P)H-hydrate repair Nnr-like enzyme with NAD(P)H-hydrate dehydratase domain
MYTYKQELAHALGGGNTHPHTHITICLKAREDIIANKEKWVVVTEEGAKRRSGGLGDILAGTMGVLLHWSRLMNE